MVQIKLFSALALAAAAIAPVVALPVTLENGSVLYGVIVNDDYFFLIV